MYGTGKYENATEIFEFKDHLLNGDAQLPEWNRLILSSGVVYYRSKRDLDVESVSMHFKGDYRLGDHYTVSVQYTGENFDDLTKLYSYYTANIVEITIARDILF